MLQPVATIELVLMDASGSTSAVVVNIPASSTVEQADASALALASLVVPLSDCAVVRYRIVWRNSDWSTGLTASGAAIKDAGAFIFSDFDEVTAGLITIPGLSAVLLATDGPGAGVLILEDSTEVNNLVDELILMNASNLNGTLFLHLQAAYLQSRV